VAGGLATLLKIIIFKFNMSASLQDFKSLAAAVQTCQYIKMAKIITIFWHPLATPTQKYPSF